MWTQGGKTKNTLGGSRHCIAGNATVKEALGERNNRKLPRCSYASRSTDFLFPVPVSRRAGERVALFLFLVPILPSVSEVAFRGDRPRLRAEARVLHLSLVQFSLRLAAKRLMLLCLLPRTWGNADGSLCPSAFALFSFTLWTCEPCALTETTRAHLPIKKPVFRYAQCPPRCAAWRVRQAFEY